MEEEFRQMRLLIFFPIYEGKDDEVMFTNLRVRTRLILLTAVAAVAMCIMGVMNMSGMEKSYRQIGRAHV